MAERTSQRQFPSHFPFIIIIIFYVCLFPFFFFKGAGQSDPEGNWAPITTSGLIGAPPSSGLSLLSLLITATPGSIGGAQPLNKWWGCCCQLKGGRGGHSCPPQSGPTQPPYPWVWQMGSLGKRGENFPPLLGMFFF